MEKLHSGDDVVEEKLIFVTDSYSFDGTKTFPLTLKPSSVLTSLDVVTRDLKNFQNNKTLRVMYARDYKEWFLCVLYSLSAC